MNKKNIILLLAFFCFNTMFGAGPAEDDSHKRFTKVDQIFEACNTGDTETIQKLFEEGMDPNLVIRTEDGNEATILGIACQNGQKEIVEFLFSKNVDSSKHQIKFLNGCKSKAFGIACNFGRKEIVELLLSKNVDPNEHQIEFPNGQKTTTLGIACQKNNKEIVELLLSNNVDPDKPHWTLPNRTTLTALGLACDLGRKEIVELLLSKNVDPYKYHIEFSNGEKETALGTACHKNRKEIVELLLSNNVDPDKPHWTLPNGVTVTALGVACHYGHKEIIELLLKSGSSFKRTNSLGRNAYELPTLTDEIKAMIKKYAATKQDSCPLSIEPFKKNQHLHFLSCCCQFITAHLFSEWKCTRLEQNRSLICPCCQKTPISKDLDTLEYPFEQTAEEQTDTEEEDEISAAGSKEDTDNIVDVD